MKRQISITSNSPALHSYLNADLPNGVKIISEPPIERKGIGLDIVINIDIIVDLTKITALACVVWLCNRSRGLKGEHKVNINDKQIPIDHPEAVELITKQVEHKSQE